MSNGGMFIEGEVISIPWMTSGLSVDIFSRGHGAPTTWIHKGPKQILEDPSIEINYIFSNSGGPLGPQVKFRKGLIGFSEARDPKLRPPRKPWNAIIKVKEPIYIVICYTLTLVLVISIYSVLECITICMYWYHILLKLIDLPNVA